jgi:glycolate oxidase iron-sulfur subunit
MIFMSDDPRPRSKEDPAGRIAELAGQCVLCGLCQPHCPTYVLDANEAESPRGRIRLAQALASGELTADATIRLPLDHCLSCLNCESVCPSGVCFGELLIQTRALLGPRPDRPTALLGLLTRPRLARPLLALARGLRIRRWAPRLPWLFGNAERAALALLPTRGTLRTARALPPFSGTMGRVALFQGCVSGLADSAALDAACQLLRAAGFRVHTLPPVCCGAINLHDGATASAAAAAGRVARDWADQPADTLLCITPGCLGTLRRDLPDVIVEDAMGFLGRHVERLQFRPLDERVALHMPCTQNNVARNGAVVRALLDRVPGLDVRELPATPGCCGAAGSHGLTFPERAERLRDRVLGHLAPLSPDRLLSSNIGCRLHLAAGDHALATEHPLTLLARQLQPGTHH